MAFRGFEKTLGWAEQLSTNSKIFLFWPLNFLSSFNNHSSKMTEVIQAFLLFLYVNGRDLAFLKQRGFLDFPIMSRSSFSVPDMLHAAMTVTRSLLCFPP